MEILERHEVPTGDMLIVKGDRGKLEMLSLSDYGKQVNLKCDALGLDRDIERVTHTDTLPLEKKWVITISTQYGCSMDCSYCDVPKVGPGKNATLPDLANQVVTGLQLHPDVKTTKRLNVHFARMGEPSWNPNVLDAAKWLKTYIDPEYKAHPVVSTMMPKKNIWLKTFVHTWMQIKNRTFRGEAGLQISVNSTNENERNEMFSGNAHTLLDICLLMNGSIPSGRKITLNFAIADWEIDPEILLRYFDPRNYIVKLTPMHKTAMAENNGIRTPGDYLTMHPYQEHEDRLKAAGYDVLVFIASEAEDLGRITCGNAILAGTKPFEVV